MWLVRLEPASFYCQCSLKGVAVCFCLMHRVLSLKLPPVPASKAAPEVWNAMTDRVYSASVDGLSSLLTRHQVGTAARRGKMEDFQTAFVNAVSH